MPVSGTVRPVIMTAGKMAIYGVLDAETGKWIYSKDLGLQNIVTSIDPVTGKRTSIPNRCRVMAMGASSVRMRGERRVGSQVESCMDLKPVRDGRGSLSTRVRWSLRPAPNPTAIAGACRPSLW